LCDAGTLENVAAIIAFSKEVMGAVLNLAVKFTSSVFGP
jgi:hypothetical protein